MSVETSKQITQSPEDEPEAEMRRDFKEQGPQERKFPKSRVGLKAILILILEMVHNKVDRNFPYKPISSKILSINEVKIHFSKQV